MTTDILPAPHSTQPDESVSSTGAHAPTTSDGDATGTSTSGGLDTSTSSPASASTSGDSTGPADSTGASEYLCFASECETNEDCGDGRVCYVALDAFKGAGIKTCHSKCEVATDCARGCDGLVTPKAMCARGTCELVACTESSVDCDCNVLGGVNVCT